MHTWLLSRSKYEGLGKRLLFEQTFQVAAQIKPMEKTEAEEMLRGLKTSEQRVLYPPAEKAWMSDSDTRAVTKFKGDFF